MVFPEKLWITFSLDTTIFHRAKPQKIKIPEKKQIYLVPLELSSPFSLSSIFLLGFSGSFSSKHQKSLHKNFFNFFNDSVDIFDINLLLTQIRKMRFFFF
jgi:hypothetical protein